MDIDTMIYLGKKAQAWLNTFPELRAGLDGLLDLAQAQKAKAEPPTPGKLETEERARKELIRLISRAGSDTMRQYLRDQMELWVPRPDAPEAEAEPEPVVVSGAQAAELPDGSVIAPCTASGVPTPFDGVALFLGELDDRHLDVVRALHRVRVLYRAPEPEKSKAPDVGDRVSMDDLDRVPVGTVVELVDGPRGIVRENDGGRDVSWEDAKLRQGGAMRVVLLPKGTP